MKKAINVGYADKCIE